MYITIWHTKLKWHTKLNLKSMFAVIPLDIEEIKEYFPEESIEVWTQIYYKTNSFVDYIGLPTDAEMWEIVQNFI